jgi:acetoacetyl-CoA synthetase
MPLWTPSAQRSAASALQSFLDRHGFRDYDSAWAWSVAPDTAGDFWAAVASGLFDFSGRVLAPGPAGVEGAKWFPSARLNYASVCLQRTGPSPAVIALSDSRADSTLSWDDLRALVASVRAGLVEAGVGLGDTVAGYLPNIPETLATMLAAASLGAIWTCCAPEVGVAGCLDRLSQCEPSVLVGVDGYMYGGRRVDRTAELVSIRAGLPSVRRAVWVPYLGSAPLPEGWTAWESFTSATAPLAFEAVPFDHPLYVLYSSGTTGRPKALVHGHGGITLEHFKSLSLHFDAGAADRFFWFTTTGWMMWNLCVSGLLTGSTVVLFDGDPAGGRLWEVMAGTGTTVGGVGSGYLVNCMKERSHPGADFDLSGLVTLGATGSPLPAAAASWVYEAVGSDLMLGSFSGGTDVCTGFVGTTPLHPVWAGEISCRLLGCAVEVFDPDGRPVVDQEGELVLTAALPSMPVGILGDADGARYHSTYFSQFPGVWAHGDRATLTDRGTVIITGRSDGTLNRGGVRMGTAEFYAVVEGLDAVADSLAVHLEDPDGGPGELLLFVVPAASGSDSSGSDSSDSDSSDSDSSDSDSSGSGSSLVENIRLALRRQLSPRHVPDAITVVAAIPRTLSGKKLEVPVKRILAGVPVADAVSLPSVADPSSLDPFVALAASRSDR